MVAHAVSGEESAPVEFGILAEIRESEKKADEILEKARREKDSIIQQAARDSSKLISSKEDEIKKNQEAKLADFREKSKLIAEEKMAEGKISAKQVKSRSEKNAAKAVEFVMKKFEEMF